MFKLIYLVSSAAAITSNAEYNTKLQNAENQEFTKLKSREIHGGSNVTLESSFNVPKPYIAVHTIVADPEKYCVQCVFTGGNVVPNNIKINELTGKRENPWKCLYTVDAKKQHSKTRGKIEVFPGLTYKHLFDGLQSCSTKFPKFNEAVNTKYADAIQPLDQHIQDSVFEKLKITKEKFDDNKDESLKPIRPNCQNTFLYTNFTKNTPEHGTWKYKKASHQTTQYSWSYTWINQDKSTQGDWCYFSNILPTGYKGGLVLNFTDHKDTEVAIRYYGSGHGEKYFNRKTLVTNSLSGTKVIPIVTAERVEIFYLQWPLFKKKFTKNEFKVEFSRISTNSLVALFVTTSPVTCWIVIAILLVATFGLVQIFKKCCHGEVGRDIKGDFNIVDDAFDIQQREHEQYFYASEDQADCYVRC